MPGGRGAPPAEADRRRLPGGSATPEGRDGDGGGEGRERPPPGPVEALRLRLRRLREAVGANRVVLALSVTRLGDGIGNSLLLIALPLYVAEMPDPGLGLPDPVLVGVVVSLFGLVNVVAQPVGGVLTDRLGRRKALIQAGLAVMGVGTVAFLWADRYAHLVWVRAFQALGFALTLPASMSLITAATTRHTRGGAMGVFTTFRMLGFAVGPLLGGLLHVAYGFDAVFLAGAATIFLGMACVQIWVDEEDELLSRRAEEGGPGTGREPGGGAERAASGPFGEIPEGVPEPGRAGGAPAGGFRAFDPELLTGGIVALGVATFVMAAAISMMTTLENEFNERLQQTALGFGVAFSALTVTRLLVQVPLGSLSDRIGRKPLVIAGLLLLAPATAVLGAVGTTLQLTGARLVQGLATAAVAAPAFALAGDLSRVGGEGRQLSVLTVGFSLGIGIGPLVAGLLAVVSFQLPFLVGAGLCLAAAGVVQRWVPRTPAQPDFRK